MKAVSLAVSRRTSSYRRKLVVAVLAVLAKCIFALAAFASAEEPKPHANWQAVVNLPPGLKVIVKARSQHVHCFFVSANETALTCSPDKAGTPVIISRNDIVTIKVSHRVRSALIGAGVGGGALAIAGFAITTNSGDSFFGPNFLRGPTTAVGALGGGLIGGSIGALADFSKSTIYSLR